MDYDALARELGGSVVKAPPSGNVDYEALAKEFGGKIATDENALSYAKGIASAATPVLGSMATGAAIGGVLGGPPGAVLGAGIAPLALGVSDLAVAGYNVLAQRLGYRPQVPPSVAMQVAAEALGIGQRSAAPVTEALVSGGLSALGGATAARAITPALTSPVSQGVANVMAEQPFLQTLAGGAGSAVPAAMAEYGDVRNPLALTAAGLAAGGIVPVGVNALRAVTPALENVAMTVAAPIVGPANKLLAGKLDQGGQLQARAAAVKQGLEEPVMEGVPRRTAAEAAALGGRPDVELAGLEASLAGGSAKAAEEAFKRQQEIVGAIQGRLRQIDDALKTQAAALAPGDATRLKQVRDTLMRELADEQQTLANTAQVAAQPLPTVRQQGVGETIQTRGGERARQMQREVISPAYDRSFEADLPEPSINLAGPFQAAERLVGNIGTMVDPTQVSPAVRNILRLEPIAPGAEAAPVAPIVSLEDFHSVRRALNKQMNATRNIDPTRANGIRSVINQMDAALESSPVPQEAKSLYREANRLVREQQTPMFRTGETGKMLSQGTFNMPGTLPSQQVAAFLKNEEGAAQFVRTFQGDQNALSSMQQGVLDLYRRAVVSPTTRAVDPKKAAAFEQKYARQLDTLEDAGLNVRETMAQVRDDTTRVQQAMDALATEASKFGKAKSADEVVDLALKSPMDMRFVRDRLTPTARTALSDELIRRAVTSIDNNDPAAAIKYLTENRKAILAGLGKNTKPYDEALGAARFQKDLADAAKQAPAPGALTPEKLREALTPDQITNLKGLAEQVKREIELVRQMDEMTSVTGTKASGTRVATELAEEVGTSAKELPPFFSPLYTAGKNTLRRFQERMDRKTTTALKNLLINNPEKIVELAEQAARPSRLAPKRGMSAGAFSASTTAVPLTINAMSREEYNQNTMTR